MVWLLCGSSGILHAGQCQNDIYLTDSSAITPQNGDLRLVVQATGAPQAGMLYVEVFSNRWKVMHWPPNVIFQDSSNPINVNPPTIQYPAASFANPAVLNTPTIRAHTFVWQHRLTVRYNNNESMYYIAHQPRAGRLHLEPQVPEVRARILGLRWGGQVNQWRRADFQGMCFGKMKVQLTDRKLD